VLILEAGERRSLEIGVARKDYQFHVIRDRGWPNDCVGYHIKGDILDADRAADTFIQIEGLVYMLVISLKVPLELPIDRT